MMTSAGTIRAEAPLGSGVGLEGGACGAFLLGDEHQTLAAARVGWVATNEAASGHSSAAGVSTRGKRDHLPADLGKALGAAFDGVRRRGIER
jgi:hypothetical protein